jgi:transcriptional regulator GlxA family with amidase domain
MPATSPLPRVAILASPEATASVVYGMYDLFRSAGRDWGVIVHGQAGPERIDPRLVARSSAPMSLANGVQVTPHGSIGDDEQFAVVCVPELAIAPDQPITGHYLPELAWLRRQHEGGAIIATACSGAVLAAEAGLLDGCEATTHWAYCDALRTRYPNVKVLPERALVCTGVGERLVMAGGGTTWLDLALHLIARLADVETAMQTARVHLIDWRELGQRPFLRLARTPQTDDAVIGKCQVWIAKQYAVAAPVASMVRLSGLPERTFKRRFVAATGLAPLAYVHMLRLEAAKQGLETSERSIAEVALDVGYEDPAFFARLFRRAVQLTPAEYRRKFGGLRRSLTLSQVARKDGRG